MGVSYNSLMNLLERKQYKTEAERQWLLNQRLKEFPINNADLVGCLLRQYQPSIPKQMGLVLFGKESSLNIDGEMIVPLAERYQAAKSFGNLSVAALSPSLSSMLFFNKLGFDFNEIERPGLERSDLIEHILNVEVQNLIRRRIISPVRIHDRSTLSLKQAFGFTLGGLVYIRDIKSYYNKNIIPLLDADELIKAGKTDQESTIPAIVSKWL